MMTLEPPRGVPEGSDVWRVAGLSRVGLARFATAARKAAGVACEVDVLLTSDAVLRRLNREFRGQDKATDVLSFPAAAEVAEQHAGDLAISLQTADRQARRHGHTLDMEVRVLLLHGMLHLRGMDHETDSGEMALREAELRKRLKLPQGLIGRTKAEIGREGVSAASRFGKSGSKELRPKRMKAPRTGGVGKVAAR